MGKLLLEFRKSAEKKAIEGLLSDYPHQKVSDLNYLVEVEDASTEIARLGEHTDERGILHAVNRYKE